MLAEAMAAQDNERLLREAEEQEALMREREAQSQFRRAEMRRKVQAVRAAQNTDGKLAREMPDGKMPTGNWLAGRGLLGDRRRLGC